MRDIADVDEVKVSLLRIYSAEHQTPYAARKGQPPD